MYEYKILHIESLSSFSLKLSISHNLTVLSLLPDANILPFSLKSKEYTTPS